MVGSEILRLKYISDVKLFGTQCNQITPNSVKVEQNQLGIRDAMVKTYSILGINKFTTHDHFLLCLAAMSKLNNFILK